VPTHSHENLFRTADFYDALINWPARLSREIPFLIARFGPPGRLGLLDAGCGTGRHAVAMTQQGYRVTGVDPEAAMLRTARRLAAEQHTRPRFRQTTFERIGPVAPGPYDGIYCLGNALAATGSEKAAANAIRQFTRSLRPGGRLVLQVINFTAVLREANHGGYARGPQTATIGGRECLSMKVFGYDGRHVQLTRLNLWQDGERWKTDVSQARLFPVIPAWLAKQIRGAGLRIIARLGSYSGEPFNPRDSGDLIVVANRPGKA
jgi:SAM-dependent methyltransferase